MKDPLDEYFVFAGKIYRRNEPVDHPLWKSLRQSNRVLLVLVTLLPAVVIPIVTLWWRGKSLNLFTETAAVLQQRQKRKRKVLFNTGQSLIDKSVVTRGGVNVSSKATAVFDELKAISSALRSLVIDQKPSSQSIRTAQDLEKARLDLIKIRDSTEFLVGFRALEKKLIVDNERDHPLKWNFVRSSSDVGLLKAACSTAVPGIDMVNSRCGRCGNVSTTETLSLKRRHALRDLSTRVSLDESYEKLVLYALRTRERPQEVFSQEDCLRLVEPLRARWSHIPGKDFQSKLLFSPSFESIECDVVWTNIDTLLRQVESCFQRRGNVYTTVTCGILDSSSSPRKLYAFRDGYDLERVDCMVDLSNKRVYFNVKTCDDVMKRMILSALRDDSVVEQKDIVAHARSRESTLKVLLRSEDEFSEVHSFSIRSKDKPKTDLNLKSLAEAIRKELKIPSPVGLCLVDRVCGSGEEERRLVSRNDSIVVCMFMTELDDSTFTVLTFVRDRALCGCDIKAGVERALALRSC